MRRNFFGLDMTKVIDSVCDTCHICASLKKFPHQLVDQASEMPCEAIGTSFAADILKRERQLILVLRETVTSYTVARFVPDEKGDTLRNAILCLSMDLHPLDGPPAVIRVDPAPCFISLRDDEVLRSYGIFLEIGRIKNINKNPVAEKAIGELENEILRQEPGGGPVSELGLSTAVARLNSRIRHTGLSARELWTQRNQFTHDQLPLSDHSVILSKHALRDQNHDSSARSKAKHQTHCSVQAISVGDLVYLINDRDKTRARSRYIVVNIDGDWCNIKKFIGNQLRATSYKVKVSECFRVPTNMMSDFTNRDRDTTDDSEEILPPVI